jgi:hypothetical protein
MASTSRPIPTDPTTDLADLSTAIDTIYANLSADILTVMGPAGAPRSLTASELIKKLKQTVKSFTDGKKGDKWLIKELDTQISKLVTDERQEAVKTATDAVGKQLQSATSNSKMFTQTAIKACQDKLKALAQSQLPGHPVINIQRQAVIAKYDASVALNVEVSKQTATHEITIKNISNQLSNIYITQDPADQTVGKEITRLQMLRRSIEEEMAHLQRKLINHFDESITMTGGKKTQIDLVMPKSIEQGKGQTLIDNMRAYLRNRANEYYAILPEMHRISDDFDPVHGTYYKPPSKTKQFDTVDSAYRTAYSEQAETLFLRIKSLTPADIMNRACSTFKYGMHEQYQTKCEDGDGPTLYFALVSLFKPAKAIHRDELIDHFNQAYLHFQKGDPKKKVEHLRPRLVDAIQLGIQLNWSTTGKKIVQVLSRSDHVMGRKIDKYENGPTDDKDTNTYLQELFATIEAECNASTRISFDTKPDTKWHTQAHNATATEMSDKECRYGANCYRKQCSFKHPDRPGPMRSTHTQRNRQGKGSGKGGWSDRKHDKTDNKRGKGGKEKHICKAKNCIQAAPAADKLCTTCFKLLRSKGGSITCKDGSEFQLQDTKQKMYGFTAQQIEGIKLVKHALTAGELDSDQDEQAAPASIKRQRIMDRLGWANSSKAKETDNRLKFLKAITLE